MRKFSSLKREEQVEVIGLAATAALTVVETVKKIAEIVLVKEA